MADKNITINETIPRKDAEWLDLCAWLEKEIFLYDSKTHLKKQASLVLKGLRHGQSIANNACETYGDYPFKVIKMAFIAHKNEILNAIRGKNFNGSEATKMRYVCAIIRDKIDDVYLRYMDAQKSQNKVETMNTDVLEYYGAEYTVKTEIQTATPSKLDKKFEELW